MDILKNLEAQFANIEEIKHNLIKPVKIQLHPNVEGFESPTAYGMYRNTGGKPLGVVGKDFEPQDLERFFNNIVESVSGCGSGLDLSKLSYKEYRDGGKVVFELPLEPKKIESPMKGDVIAQKLQFKTGFDGLTKTTLSFYSLRLWCDNGAANWENDLALSFKNTKGNVGKAELFCDEIFRCIAATDNYVQNLNELAKVKVTKAEQNKFIEALTGYKFDEYNEMNARRRGILDRINASIAIEVENTGLNKFSLLQGITRYTTHDLAKGNEEALLFGDAALKSKAAHRLLILN